MIQYEHPVTGWKTMAYDKLQKLNYFNILNLFTAFV